MSNVPTLRDGDEIIFVDPETGGAVRLTLSARIAEHGMHRHKGTYFGVLIAGWYRRYCDGTIEKEGEECP